MLVFADTSALFALLARNDYMHVRAKAAFEYFRNHDTILVTSSYVLVETMALVQSRLGMDAAIDFHQKIEPLLEIVWVDNEWHSKAAQRLLAIRKNKVSLVDCLSFIIMEAREINIAYSYDKHFQEQGFTLITHGAYDSKVRC